MHLTKIYAAPASSPVILGDPPLMRCSAIEKDQQQSEMSLGGKIKSDAGVGCGEEGKRVGEILAKAIAMHVNGLRSSAVLPSWFYCFPLPYGVTLHRVVSLFLALVPPLVATSLLNFRSSNRRPDSTFNSPT